MTTKEKTARRKGAPGGAVAAGSAGLLVIANGPLLGGLGLAGAGYLTYDWFMFRAKNGMRF